MFKQTTVAVDGEEGGFSSIDGVPMTPDIVTEEPLIEDKGNSGGFGQSSPKPGPAISFSLRKNNSSPTPSGGAHAPKVSVSFSFAKKAPVKLETAAAVFADHGEEALEGEEVQEEAVEKMAGEEVGTASSTDSPQSVSGGMGGGDEQPQSDDGGTLASTLNKLKMMMKKEEGYSGQEPQYYHYMPPAHCRVKPHFQFLLFMKASDQCGSQEEEEDGEDEQNAVQAEEDVEQKESNDSDCKSENDTVKEAVKELNINSTSIQSPKVKPEEVSEITPAVASKADSSSTLSKPVELNQGSCEPQDSGPRIPIRPFFPVLSKDESTTLQWPSELLEFTKAEPSLSYSCNPLYFDFKLSRNKGNRGGKTNKAGKPANADGEGSKSEDTSGTAATSREPSTAAPQLLGVNTHKKDESSLKEKTNEDENKDKKLENSEDGVGGSKKKKKKKKHKKSNKRAKRKEKDKVEGEMETETAGEKTKKKKKHKRKKNKNKVCAEEEEKAGESKEEKVADEKGGTNSSAQLTGETLTSDAGKRKRLHKEVAQRPVPQEGSTGKTISSEEHSGTKRLKPDSSTSLASCSASAHKSPVGGRPPTSESDEDGGSASQRSRRPHRHASPPRERRHHSEESRQSGRSRSRSSRRGERNHRRNRGKTSRSRSYSSSSERSSAGSSAYSRRSHSYSDSYSDYSDGEHHRRTKRRSSDSEYERRGSGRSHRRHYSSSSSEEDSRSRSRSHSRRKHHRRRRHRSSSRSYSRSSRSSSARSYRYSSYSRSRSSASRSSSSTKGSQHRRSHNRRADSSSRRRDFNRSRIYRSQSPRSSSSRVQPRTSNSTQSTKGSGGGGTSEHRNSLTARQLLEKVQARKGGEDSGTGSKPGTKIKDPPQGYFGPKLPPVLGNKNMLPLFGKLQAGKKLPLLSVMRTDDGEKSGLGKGSDTSNEVILVEPIREFPPPPPPPPPPVQQQQQQQVEEPILNTVVSEEARNQDSEPQVHHESRSVFDQESATVMSAYQGEAGQDPNNTMIDGCILGSDMSQQAAMHAYQGYPVPNMEEEDMGMEAEEDGLAPLESQPITFTPEEIEKYSKLQQAAQQHIQQQLLAKQVKTFPSAAAAAAAANLAAAASLVPAPPPPPAALQQIHIQQPAVSATSATSITTVQHAILQHHAAATAMGIHPHTPHHAHPAHAQLAQVHHIPQHHLTPISLSPLGHTLGHTLGHSLGPTGLIPAHHSAFLPGQPIHIIPASALHHAPLALHHVPHAALYPTLFAPRPATAAAAAALQLHPLLHPIFSGQDLQHPPNHGS